MNATVRARLNVALSMTIFGTLPLFVRQVHASSAMIALMRAAIALIALAAVYLLRGGRGLRVESKKEMLLLLASGAAMGVNWILLFEAYNYVSVQIATLLYYFAPVIVAAAGALLFHERMGVKRGLCFVGAAAGLLLTIGPDIFSGSIRPAGVACGLGAAILYATVILLNTQIRSVGGVERTILQFAAATAVLIVYVALSEGIHLERISGREWIFFSMLGLIHTALAFSMYFSGLTRLSGQEAAFLGYIDPMVAILVGCLILREPTTAIQLLGGAMILAFTLIAQLPGKKIHSRAKQ